jgi:serine/threonine protein kinase
MREICLSKGRWYFDEAKSLGPPGGFGEVFLGKGENGNEVAVKRVRLEQQVYSTRELKIAEFLLGHDHPHVIPILDAGMDDASGLNFIVMARADQSLQDVIRKSAPLSEHEALEISGAISAGLSEINALVHRDLKPANVLFHNGVWKIADLGLARFVEASTSPETMRGFLSAPYAAPELWRNERPTKAADIYSLGCIIYALTTGQPPFSGPAVEDYSYQHQFVSPPQLPASAKLRQIASACLAKNQELRPSIESFRAQIQRTLEAVGTYLPNPLAQAAAILAEERSIKDAQEALKKKVETDRKAVAAEAVKNIRSIIGALLETIVADAPNAQVLSKEEARFRLSGVEAVEMVVRLGKAYLICCLPFPYLNEQDLWPANWDVIVGATIEVRNEWPKYGPPPSRSANLWFGNLTTGEGYRWWEVAYMFDPSRIRKQDDIWEPFCLSEGPSYSRPAIHWLRGRDGVQFARNPRPVDGEYLESFNTRWKNWLAKASLTTIERPQELPEERIDTRFLARIGAPPNST